MIKKLFLFFTILTSLFCATPALAAGAGDVVMSVNPSEQELALTPGKRKSSSITVYNNGRLAFDFEVSAKPYSIGSALYEPDFITDTSYTKLSNWITFPKAQFHVEPGQAAVVDFNVTVPEGIPGSGQYAAIIVRITGTDGENSAAMQMVAQIAALIYGHVRGGELIESGEMVSHDLPSFMLGSGFRMTATFHNSGNIDFRVRQTLEVTDFFTGKVVITPDTEGENGSPLGTMDWTILPDTTRIVSTVWQNAPELGFFRVKQTLTFLDQTEVFEKVVFLCPIWLLVGVIILIAIIVIWIILRARDRKQDAPQVF